MAWTSQSQEALKRDASSITQHYADILYAGNYKEKNKQPFLTKE